jgi:pimeloyl-ACP methyl ester carboxylesterase
VVSALASPAILVGHSSGAVVALETLVADLRPFVGAVLYEPPLMTEGPIGGPDELALARSAMERNRPGEALQIFLRTMVRLPVLVGVVMRLVTLVNATMRGFVPRQLDDTEALNLLGVRLAAYAQITVPTLLLEGERSPGHLRDRTRALASVLTRARVQELRGQGHGANRAAPDELARLISALAAEAFRY